MLTGRALERILYRTVIVGAVIVAPLFALGASAVTIPPTIAAASNLRFGLEEIARIFHRDTGVKVRLSFGSSGNFARQIRQGAPFELYMSADEVYVLDLARDEFTIGEGELMAHDVPLGCAPDEYDDLILRISVNPIGRFGFIRSLFHLLFRPCQFYLK